MSDDFSRRGFSFLTARYPIIIIKCAIGSSSLLERKGKKKKNCITRPAVLIFKWANNTQDILSSFSRSSPSNTKSNHSNDISYFLSLSLSFSRARIWLSFVQHRRNEIIFLFSLLLIFFFKFNFASRPKSLWVGRVYLFFRSMNLVIPITSLGPTGGSITRRHTNGGTDTSSPTATKAHTHTLVCQLK